MERLPSCNILVIEPDHEVFFLISKILMENDCLVHHETTAKDGIDAAYTNHFNIVICDNQLTDISAKDVFITISDHLRKSGTGFFLIYEDIDLEDLTNFLDIGIDNFIGMPINEENLIRKVNNYLVKCYEFDAYKTKMFRDFFKSTPNPMFILDNNKIISYNKSCKRLLGKKMDDLNEVDFLEVLKNSENYRNIANYYKLKKGFIKDCVLKDISIHKKDEIKHDIFLYRRSNQYDGRILAEIVSTRELPNIGSIIENSEDIVLGKSTHKKSEYLIDGDTIVFTVRELEILYLSVKGLPIKQIASKLSISKRTVEKHRSNIMRKTDSHSIIEAIRKVQHLIVI